jgi:hypothetical protein
MAAGDEDELAQLEAAQPLGDTGGLGGTNTFQRDPNLPLQPRRAVTAPRMGATGVSMYQVIPNYTGPDLTDANDQISRKQYNEVTDAKNILDSMTDLERMLLLKDVSVATNGLYKPDLRSAGLSDEDYTAFGELVLRTANNIGRTYDVALDYMKANVSKWNPVGTGRSYSVSSSDDIKDVLKETSLTLLGYIPDAQTLNRLTSNIQQEQMRPQMGGGGMVEAASQVGNQAVRELMASNPMEAKVQGAATISSIIREALGG